MNNELALNVLRLQQEFTARPGHLEMASFGGEPPRSEEAIAADYAEALGALIAETRR